MAYRKQYRKAGGGENGINVKENGVKAKQCGEKSSMVSKWQWLKAGNG
jgi:hypothetical protein